MSVSGIEGPHPVGEPQPPGNQRRFLHIGRYYKRKVVTAFTNKKLGYRPQPLTAAEKKDRRKAARSQRRAEQQAQKTAEKQAVKTARSEIRNSYGDKFAVVLELAHMADKMEPDDYASLELFIQASQAITTLIMTLLKEIEKQEEREAEQKQEEHEQDLRNQHIEKARHLQEEHKKHMALQQVQRVCDRLQQLTRMLRREEDE